jgi:uncharacterized protein YdcH (DUF465 family)
MMDKYDEAIEFLKSVEPGSYFDECAELMEELVAQIEQAKPNKFSPSKESIARLKQMQGAAIYYAKSRGLR